MRDLPKIMASGYVTRWHANPDMAHIRETLAEHHARVAQIVLALHPAPTLELIDAALHHDCGELVTGDIPATSKWDPDYPAIQISDIENAALCDMGIYFQRITDADRAWIKFADRLAAYLHVEKHRPEITTRADWMDAGNLLAQMGQDLGIIVEWKWDVINVRKA